MNENAQGVRPVPRDADLPLSFAQQRLWFLDQLRPGSTEYLVPVALRLRGPLGTGQLRWALDELVARHEVLRTRYEAAGPEEPRQVVDPPAPVPLAETDLSGLPGPQRDARLAGLLAEESGRPVDLARGPLLRASLVRLAEDEHLLLLVTHHIAFDGWSVGVLLTDLAELYTARSAGRAPRLPVLGVQYADHAVWQRQQAARPANDAEADYWLAKLAGVSPLELPADRGYGPEWDPAGDAVALEVPAETARRLAQIGRRGRATPFMTLLAALNVLLARYTGQTDIVVGTPIAGRSRPEVAGLIGFFANTLVLRTDLSGAPSFTEVLSRVRDTALDAYTHQDFQFEHLVDKLGLSRELSHNPLIQVVFVLQGREQPPPAWEGLEVTQVPVEWFPARFDLAVTLDELADGRIRGRISYASALFDRATAERFAAHYAQLIESIAASPGTPVSRLAIMPAPERRRIETWDPVHCHAVGRCLHQMVQDQARSRPDAVAVVSGSRQLRYADLNAAANRLAGYLRELGAGPESLVGVRLHRGIDLVVTLLAVLKTGAGYLPLDPEQPAARLAFVLEDAGARIVVSATELAADIPPGPAQVVLVDGDRARIAAHSGCDADSGATPDNLAYAIYTSGSTGRPKGVMISHADVTRLFAVTAPGFGFCADDVWSCCHSYAFDFSVWEIWGALTTGGRVVMVPAHVARSPRDLLRLLADARVTILSQTPTAFRGLAEAAVGDDAGAGRLALRAITFGGEALDVTALRPWIRRFGDRLPLLINMYGITETTVHVTWKEVTAGDAAEPPRGSPVGVPLGDLSVTILDPDQNVVPVGVCGEIYVGGAGLARGYLNRPALTAERFVPDPFGTRPGARLYRSGDKARRRPDGELEFFGRLDKQVKIRGHRIELGEIESALSSLPGIAAAAVDTYEPAPGDRQLAAYLVWRDGQGWPAREIRGHLAARLPGYMVPARYVTLDRLPYTPNGKLDRRALPAPDQARPDVAASYVAPRSAAEALVAEVWTDMLDIDRAGVYDNFFELGGDSIRAVRVVGALRAAGVEVTVQDIFRRQTVAELAELSDTTAATRTDDLPVKPFALISDDRAALPADAEDAYPLGLVQAGMVYELLSDTDAKPYHNVTSYPIRDDAPVDPETLRAAARQVSARHEILRTAFDLSSYSEPLQLVYATAEPEIGFSDLRGLAPAAQEAAVARSLADQRARLFDIGTAPLWRLHVHQTADDAWRLIFVEHHAILDGWSHNSLLTELLHTYRDLRDGRKPSLAPPPVRVATFIALEQQALSSSEDRAFWASRLGALEPHALPGAWSDPAGEAAPYELRVPFGDIAAELRQLGRSAGAPLKTVLLAAHLRVMAFITDQPRFTTGVVVNGRPETAGGDQVLGMFLNVVPFPAELTAATAPTWLDFVREVFASEVSTWPHRRYPLTSMQREWGAGRAAMATVFNYLEFHVLDQRLVDLGGTVDISPNEFALAASCDPAQFILRIDPRRVHREAGARLAELYREVLAAMAADPEGDPLRLRLPHRERHRQLAEYNPAVDEPGAGLLHETVARWARETPGAAAISFDGAELTYAGLDARAAGLALRLRALGVHETGAPVAICLPRGVGLVVAMLGVLKAGAAFLPLDPDSPPARLSFILADSGARIVLTDGATRDRVPGDVCRIVGVDDEEALATAPADAARPASAALDDPAYVIYTSGSTGQPKGAVIEHRGLANMLAAEAAILGIGPGDRVTQLASPAFDATILEITMALGHGATLVPGSRDRALPGRPLADLLRQEAITHAFLVPSALAQLPVEDFPALAAICVGGEECPEALARRWAGRCRLVNLYGPTECSVFASHAPVSPEAPGKPVIGLPIPNAELYILDRDLQVVPSGVPGELCIGGACVGRGYLGRPALTAEFFVPHPFSSVPGARLYRTGDRARRLRDGRVDFLGRIDFQVKIRGHRIELGEVEAALLGHPCVAQAACAARDDGHGNHRLVAYLVAAGPPVPDRELRSFLAAALPGYMVPAAFAWLDTLPVNASGKVDRSALPDAAGHRSGHEVSDPPRTRAERVVAELWREALGVAAVGRDDDFFDSGGDSLAAARLVLRLSALVGSEVTVRALYENPTVAGLAAATAGVAETWRRDPEGGAAEVVPRTPWPARRAATDGVLLTGATGFLGARVLRALLSRTAEPVHCLVRADGEAAARERLRAALDRRGMAELAASPRVRVTAGDLRAPLLGLSQHEFARLSGRVGAIYHCAGQAGELQSYESVAGTNVGGTRELLRIAAMEPPSPLYFVSPLAAADLDPPGSRDPDPDVSGYVASKWRAERLLAAARARGVPASIYRLPRLAGESRTGRANDRDLITRLLTVILRLGVAPDLGWREHWVPVDMAAEAFVARTLDAGPGGDYVLLPEKPVAFADVIELTRRVGPRIESRQTDEWRRLLASVPSPEHVLMSALFGTGDQRGGDQRGGDQRGGDQPDGVPARHEGFQVLRVDGPDEPALIRYLEALTAQITNQQKVDVSP